MFKSESIKELATALVVAQKAMSNARINAENEHFGNEYADLPAVREAILGPLTDNGIAIMQIPSINAQGNFVLVTLLIHAPSGEMIAGEHPLPTSGSPQQIGSAITYARRQDASGIVFLSADKDDDAEAAEGRQTNIAPVATAAKPANGNIPFAKLEPQCIPFENDFMEWGTRFAAQLNAATSKEECVKWLAKNSKAMAACLDHAPGIHARLKTIAGREFTSAQEVVQQKKKTDARDGTSGKSAADDLESYRTALLKAKTSTEAQEVLAQWKPALTARGATTMDQAVGMYDARHTALVKTEANVAHKAT